MRIANSILTIVERLKTHKPKDEAEIRKLGIRMRYIGSGAFRSVYKVRGVPLVIKVPMCDCPETTEKCNNYCESVEHSRHEYKVYKKIKTVKKYRVLRGFMPQIHYYDDVTGIMAMHYYKPLKYNVANSAICDLFNQFFRQVLVIGEDVDIRPANVGVDEEQYSDCNFYKIVDLGCIHRSL